MQKAGQGSGHAHRGFLGREERPPARQEPRPPLLLGRSPLRPISAVNSTVSRVNRKKFVLSHVEKQILLVSRQEKPESAPDVTSANAE